MATPTSYNPLGAKGIGEAGTIGATTRSALVRAAVAAFTTVSFAVPTFISGVVLVLVFAVWLRVLPPGGHASLVTDPLGSLRFLLLPAVCLALPASAVSTESQSKPTSI